MTDLSLALQLRRGTCKPSTIFESGGWHSAGPLVRRLIDAPGGARSVPLGRDEMVYCLDQCRVLCVISGWHGNIGYIDRYMDLDLNEHLHDAGGCAPVCFGSVDVYVKVDEREYELFRSRPLESYGIQVWPDLESMLREEYKAVVSCDYSTRPFARDRQITLVARSSTAEALVEAYYKPASPRVAVDCNRKCAVIDGSCLRDDEDADALSAFIHAEHTILTAREAMDYPRFDFFMTVPIPEEFPSDDEEADATDDDDREE